MRTELVSAVDFRTITKGKEKEPPKRLFPLLIFVILAALALYLANESQRPQVSSGLLNCKVTIDGDEATIEYETQLPCETKVTFNKKERLAHVVESVNKHEHKVTMSGLSRSGRYSFVVQLPDETNTLPISFSTKNPVSDLRAFSDDSGTLIEWRNEQGTIECRYRSGGSSWQSLSINTAGVDSFNVTLPQKELPDEIELIHRSSGKATVKHIVPIGVGQILLATIKRSPVYQKTKRLFANGPQSNVPWQRGALPGEENFAELISFLEVAKETAFRILTSSNVNPGKKKELFIGLTLCHMMSNWAPAPTRDKLIELDELCQEFCPVNFMAGSEYSKVIDESKGVIVLDGWNFLLPTNFAHKERVHTHERRVERFYGAADKSVTIRGQLPKAGQLFLHLGNFWKGAMLRIKIGDMPIVVFAKEPARRSPKINGKRILKSTFLKIVVPPVAVGTKGVPFSIEGFSRYEMAQLLAFKALFLKEN